MRFAESELQGAWIIELEPFEDDRGSFARFFCENEFRAHGLETRFVQHSVSRNNRAGTLRGMHFQASPREETKLVTCIRGAVHDVIIDLRPGSPTFHRWISVELTDQNRLQLYIPKGFAHGFQTLVDDSEVMYLISEFYDPRASDGVSYDDPAFEIPWPLPISAISDKDKRWPKVS